MPEEEDIPFVDQELDPGSPRPVANQAVTRAYLRLVDMISGAGGGGGSGAMTDRQTMRQYALFVENGALYLEELEV